MLALNATASADGLGSHSPTLTLILMLALHATDPAGGLGSHSPTLTLTLTLILALNAMAPAGGEGDSQGLEGAGCLIRQLLDLALHHAALLPDGGNPGRAF
jgi:hypothetical protein